MKVIKRLQMKSSPWKNGGGTTTEIAIWPPGALFDVGQFDWRVSHATISRSGPFSKFPGYDRVLCVWQGDGILLNGKLVALDEAVRFSGDNLTEADLVESVVEDLGVICRREFARISIDVVSLAASKKSSITASVGQYVLFVCKGEISIRMNAEYPESRLDQGDALQIEISDRCSIELATKDGAKIVIVEIAKAT